MDEVRLALIGFGNVAQGLTQIIKDQGDRILHQRGLRLLIVAIADPLKGSAFDENGLDPARRPAHLIRQTGMGEIMGPPGMPWR